MRKAAIVATAIIVSCQLPIVNSLKAAPVTPQRAAVVAANFMHGRLGGKTDVGLKQHVSDWPYAGFYLFECEAGGWVLVAADDDTRPILGYSTTGTLDPASLPPALRLWLDGYEEQVAAIHRARAAGLATAAYPADKAEWQRLEWCGIDSAAVKDGGGVAPMITTHWNQQYPYDQLCPAGCVTGCAATALAMYMKFWNYPAFGSGGYTYCPPRTGTTESADFGHTLYDWTSMPDETWQYYGDTVAINAVSTLMYHCGVGMAMDYGTSASGGSAAVGILGMPTHPSIDNAMKDYFHYSPDMRARFKADGYTNDGWRSMLVAELDAGRPVLYGGASAQGGHAFVCDGYDERQYMHFNFGWSGLGDGYYPVDSISPGTGGVGGNGSYTFNMQNACLTGAEPDYALRVSDTLFNYLAAGGADSLLVGINEQSDSQLTIASTADWLTVEHDSIVRAGWLRLRVAPMAGDGERVGYIVCTQGDESVSVRVVQVTFAEEEMCPLTVVMENTSTHYTGWNDDASLTIESDGGFIFGTAHLEGCDRDTTTVLVPPTGVRSVWHSGGGTDRYVNYRILNQHGQEIVAVVNAYHHGGDHAIPAPCAHLAATEPDSRSIALYPNPARDVLTVRAEGLRRVEILDVTGRPMAETAQHKVNISLLPCGTYFVRIMSHAGVTVKRLLVGATESSR